MGLSYSKFSFRIPFVYPYSFQHNRIRMVKFSVNIFKKKKRILGLITVPAAPLWPVSIQGIPRHLMQSKRPWSSAPCGAA